MERTLTDEKTMEAAPAAAVRELVRLLVKTQKAQRLYDGKNAVSERLEGELFGRLSSHLEEEGDLHLAVLEFHLKWSDQVVYENHDRNDNLAFLLYRDGIRRVSFHRGLEARELGAFLRCLNRVALLSNDQDDLVTLFWEQDFHSIRYFAIEELSETDSYARLEDQLASGELEGASGGGAESVSLDLEQPVTTVPVEACRLNEEEIEALRAELLGEEKTSFQHLVAEIAIELTLLEDGEEERGELRENLIAIADRWIADGELEELAGLQEHLQGLATMVFPDDARMAELVSGFLEALARDDRIDGFLAKVDELHVPKPAALTGYLARLGPSIAPALASWMGRLSSPAFRRAVTNALLVSEDGGLTVLAEHRPAAHPSPESPEWLRHHQFVREWLHALSHHCGEKALPILESLLADGDVETRRESFIAASRYPDPRVDELCLNGLQDPDPEIRAAALDTLVRRGKKELGVKLLERPLGSDDFAQWHLNEKRRLFAAVAKLAGESALELLRELLVGKETRWFASKKDKQLAEAVAHGIRMVGTDRALELLQHCADRGPRFVRSACLKELGNGRLERRSP